MPRLTVPQTNFTAGEVSPRVFGRFDVQRYLNGAESLENCIVNIHGGAERRPGKRYVAPSKTHLKRCRIIPFVFNTQQAYVLEFGDFYMRVYVQSGGQVLVGGLPYEIATPYSESMIWDINVTQSADTMFIFHQLVPPQSLRRLASDNWALAAAPFVVPPFDEIGHRFNSTLTLSATTVGTGRTATASPGVFVAGDVGRRIQLQAGGTAKITAVPNASTATVDIQEAFASASMAPFVWILADSPQGGLAPSDKSPIGKQITLTFDASLAGWRADDIGKFVRINGGLAQIQGIASPSVANAVILQEMTATVSAPANAWSLESSVWNPYDGYPATGTIYEQRLVAASSPRYPQTLWGSKPGLYFDFTSGVNDDDSYTFTLNTGGQVNPIKHLLASRALLALTYGGEFTVAGGVEKPLTPTNVQAKPQSFYGCNQVRPVRVGNEALFVQRAGRKMRSMSYKFESDSYSAPDLTVLAEHITESGIVDMAYQQEARSLVWCVRGDGKMAVLTIDRDEGVTAWTPQVTDGAVESVAVIPNGTGDEVWLVVRRYVSGQTVRYIERLDETLYTDCAITGTDPVGKQLWTGITHLEGKYVDVKADGTYIDRFLVVGGQVTLSRPAKSVEIGLPFSNQIKLLRPEVALGTGTAQTNQMSTSKVSVLFLNTTGCKVDTGDGPEEMPFRSFGSELLDRPPQALTGYEFIGTNGWARGDSPLTLIQDAPLPFHALAVIRDLTVNS
ncbi:hypothetical protein [Ralstonia mannitolilytica]|uniref:hypothetical protein n=1 Tax=Ralstonia mannitolilytica TaxID=105219 RepID=UPI0007AFFF0F|nr:hypothetical protein [Ralstonia mannitolilytica]ANA34467.1 hypothetical protein VZ52_14310 [Ralstonia mannitolilytica]